MNVQTLKKQCNIAFGYANARLALNYYIFTDDLAGAETLPVNVDECTRQLRSCLNEYLHGGQPVDEVIALRSRVIREMETVTGYTNCLAIYDYVLIRMEGRFNENLKLEDETGFVDKLVQFISEAEDAAIFKHRLSMVIAQLPVRFTRHKFYAMVSEALALYTGAGKASVNTLMDNLRAISMTGLPADMKPGYDVSFEILEQFRAIDFKNISADEFKKSKLKIIYVSDLMNKYISWYMSLQELLNDLYVLLLSRDRAMADREEVKTVHAMLEMLLDETISERTEEKEEALIACLNKLEGVQEAYYEQYQRCISEFAAAADDMSGEAKISRRLDMLLSNSSFFQLEEHQGEPGLADKAWLNEVINVFIRELDEVFAKSPKVVVRVIMARILSELPLRFNSIGELKSYIANSLGSCADAAEKSACIEQLRFNMESENALV